MMVIFVLFNDQWIGSMSEHNRGFRAYNGIAFGIENSSAYGVVPTNAKTCVSASPLLNRWITILLLRAENELFFGREVCPEFIREHRSSFVLTIRHFG